MNRTLQVKHGVRITGLQREALAALDICLDAYAEMGHTMRLTSARGDMHGAYSHHYKGLAFDLGIKEIPAAAKQAIIDQLRPHLGPHYQVILEAEGTANEHLHIEYDPRHLSAYPEL